MATPLKDKDILKPNPHPYAIKTTSTALLTRSNSTSQSAKPVHNYIPSPSPSPTRSRIGHRHYGYAHGNGHRYSRSLTSESPRPLPVPPSVSPTKQLYGHGHSPSFDVDLPANPKLWTPSQLATYLATALRVRSGESLQLPSPVARDIAAFVKTSKITGKEFLRFNEQDLSSYGINKLWSSALLTASRTLRQNVLKGRIWGFGSSDFDGPSGEDNPFIEHIQYDSASSTSSLDIDRSYSDNEFFDVPFQSNAHAKDDDNTPVKRTRRGRVSLGKIRNGRVKGMVESLERSTSVDESITHSRRGSQSSPSESDVYAPHPTIRPHQTGTATFHTLPPAQYLPISYQTSEPAQSEVDSTADVYDTATEGEVGIYDTATEGGDEREEPVPHDAEAQDVSKDQADEELSMEELLAQIDAEKPSGAHAWEREVNSQGTAIVTMKHLPTSDSPLESVPTGASNGNTNGSIKGRPLPHPPASGSPVVLLPAAQVLSSHSTGSQRPLPTPGSAGSLSPRIHAPTPRHGSLRGLGASWNAIDADGVVAQLSGSVESLASSSPDVAPDGHSASLENSEGWVKPPVEGSPRGSGNYTKAKLSSGSRRTKSRKSSGQTKRPAIVEIFGAPDESRMAEEGAEMSSSLPTMDQDASLSERHPPAIDLDKRMEEIRLQALELEEKERVLAEWGNLLEGYEADKAAWLAREKELDQELKDARALVEVYKTRLEESEKAVEALQAAEVKRQEEDEAAARRRASVQSKKAQGPLGASVGLGLLMHLMPRSILGRVFAQQRVSLESQSLSSPESQDAAKDDIELGESVKASPSASSSQRPPTSSARQWTDWLSPSSMFNRFVDEPADSRRSEGQERDWGTPSTIRALPPYMILVGLGVAAVVLRVVMRRIGYKLGLGVGMRR